MEDTAIDGKRYSGFSLDAIYITTRFTRSAGITRSAVIDPQSWAHISATSGIDAVNHLIRRTEHSTIDDDLGVGF